MAHLIGVACSVSDSNRGAAGHRDHDERLQLRCFHDGFAVLDIFFGGELDSIAVGQAATAPIVANDRMVPRQHREPGPPDEAVPVKLKMANPMSNPDDRRTLATRGISNASAVAARAKPDLLCSLRHGIPSKDSGASIARRARTGE